MPDDWRIERLSEQSWFLLSSYMPTAGDLVSGGMAVEQALAIADSQTRQLNWLVGA